MRAPAVRLVVLLVLAVTVVAVSCSFEYWLEFELGTPTLVDLFTVTIPYTLTAVGSSTMYNAAINIEVSVNSGSETQSLWTTPVDLAYGESVDDTLTFTFVSSVFTATATVIAVRWDDSETSS